MGWSGRPIGYDVSMQEIKKEIISDYTGKMDGTFEDRSGLLSCSLQSI